MSIAEHPQTTQLADLMTSKGATSHAVGSLDDLGWKLAAEALGISDIEQAAREAVSDAMRGRAERGLIYFEATRQGYSLDQVEIMNDFQLPDGHTAYYVEVFQTEYEEGGEIFSCRDLIEDECFFAVVVGGRVFANVELAAFPAEYEVK